MNANDEILIDDLCTKFGDLFANIKQLRNKRAPIDDENEKL